jgi:hypothetical protein
MSGEAVGQLGRSINSLLAVLVQQASALWGDIGIPAMYITPTENVLICSVTLSCSVSLAGIVQARLVLRDASLLDTILSGAAVSIISGGRGSLAIRQRVEGPFLNPPYSLRAEWAYVGAGFAQVDPATGTEHCSLFIEEFSQ